MTQFAFVVLPGVHLKMSFLFILFLFEVQQGWVRNIDDAAKTCFHFVLL